MATQLVSSIGTILLTDITESAKCPPEKQTRSPALGSRDTVHGYFLSVAMILCNKMDFSFGANMTG